MHPVAFAPFPGGLTFLLRVGTDSDKPDKRTHRTHRLALRQAIRGTWPWPRESERERERKRKSRYFRPRPRDLADIRSLYTVGSTGGRTMGTPPLSHTPISAGATWMTESRTTSPGLWDGQGAGCNNYARVRTRACVKCVPGSASETWSCPAYAEISIGGAGSGVTSAVYRRASLRPRAMAKCSPYGR